MKLEDLKQGDIFYEVSINGIKKYEYLMLYPFHNPENVKLKGYHIVLNKSLDEPVRMYYKDLIKILEQNCLTFEDAKAKQIELCEDHLQFLKNRK